MIIIFDNKVSKFIRETDSSFKLFTSILDATVFLNLKQAKNFIIDKKLSFDGLHFLAIEK